MSRLGIYIFRQLVTGFVFATVAVSFVVLFTQMFRLLSLTINNAGTMAVFFHMLALSVPTFLPVVLPIALGVATLFVYHKMAVDSEMVVMIAAGLSPLRLAKPAMMLGGMVLMICLILTLWLTPEANRALVNLQYKVRDSYAVFLSRPGSFNDMTDGVTFYAHARGKNGALEGILMHDVRHPETPITIMADSGQLVIANHQPQMIVFNGRRQELDTTTGKLSELAFDQYVLDLAAMHSAPQRRLPDPREQSVLELLHPSTEILTRRAPREHLLAELNQRLAMPLLAIAYTLIGLAAMLAGEFNRRGMGHRILIASVSFLVVQAAFMSLNSVVARHLWFAPMLYVIALIPSALSFYILFSGMHASAPPASKKGAP